MLVFFCIIKLLWRRRINDGNVQHIMYFFKQTHKMSYNRTCFKIEYTKIIVSISIGDKTVARIIEYEAQNIVGHKVKKFRIERNMSQKELSEKLETYAIYICRGSISRIEGHRRTVTDYELKALAEILHVSIEDMFD